MHRTGGLEDHRRSPSGVVVNFWQYLGNGAVDVPGDCAAEGEYAAFGGIIETINCLDGFGTEIDVYYIEPDAFLISVFCYNVVDVIALIDAELDVVCSGGIGIDNAHGLAFFR